MENKNVVHTVNKDVAVTVQNMVQFYNIRPAVDALLDAGKSVDVYIPVDHGDSGFREMFEDTYQILKNKKYTIFREEHKDIYYKILMEPYPMDIYLTFNFKYRLRYKYDALSTKPNPVYLPENYICYDGIFCYGQYEADYLDIYGKTHVISNLKYVDFSKKPHGGKPVLLYLPTYGGVSSLEMMQDKIDDLKKDYQVIVKFHHGTSFLKDERERLEEFKKKCDRWYEHNENLATLMETADVVLSDNSGAIFEAIFAEVPIAVFAENINEGLYEFYTTQWDLVNRGFIPYTNRRDEVETILKEAMSQEFVDRQLQIKNEYFHASEHMVEEFVDVVQSYLEDKVNVRWKQLHDIFSRDYYWKKSVADKLWPAEQKIAQLSHELNDKNIELNHRKSDMEFLQKQLSYYENGKLYKCAKSIYLMYQKLFK